MVIRNLLNQPQMVEGQSLGVDCSVEVKSVTDDVRRLAEKGFVAIVTEEPPKGGTPNTEPAKGGTPNTAEGGKK